MQAVKVCSILFHLFLPILVAGQVRYDTLAFKGEKKNIDLTYSPFQTIEVIDNRFDTAVLYTFQTGNYPVIQLVLQRPAASFIKEYLEERIAMLPKGSDTLLIQLEQLRIFNKSSIFRNKYKGKHTSGYKVRDYLALAAQTYVKRNKLYYPVNCFALKYFYGDPTYIDIVIGHLFDDLIIAPAAFFSNPQVVISTKRAKTIRADSSAFIQSVDTNSYTLDQIRKPVTEKWMNYPIFSLSSANSDGAFADFDDFQSGLITQGPLMVKEDSSSGVFTATFKLPNGKKVLPWSFLHKGQYYIRLPNDKFVKMEQSTNTFYFDIPPTLPDMYALLSIEAFEQQARGVNNVGSGSGLWNVLEILTSLIIKDASANSRKKKMARKGLGGTYHHCFIDMDTGDVIY